MIQSPIHESPRGLPESFLFNTCTAFLKFVLLLEERALHFICHLAADNSVQSFLVLPVRPFNSFPPTKVVNDLCFEQFDDDFGEGVVSVFTMLPTDVSLSRP